MLNGIQKFWNETDIDDILMFSIDGIIKNLEEIAAIYSSNDVKIYILTDKVHFESMDERDIG